MKKKQPIPQAAPAAAAASAAVRPPVFTRGERIELAGFLIFLLASVILTIGRVTNIAMLLCLAFSIRKSSLAILREHISLPVAGLACMTLAFLVSGVITPFGEGTILELLRGLCAFAIAGFALLRFRKKHVPALLWCFVIASAFLALFSVEGASMSLVYDAVTAVVTPWGVDISSFPIIADRRLSGVFNNSNALASLTALAMLIGLYQLRTVESRRGRFAAAFLLGINAIAFFLCLSRGGILCFGIALIVYLLLTKKGQRLSLFLLMFFSALLTMLLSLPAFKFLGAGSPVPVLCALVCGPIVFLANEFFISRFIETFAELKQEAAPLLKISVGLWAALIVLYLFAALNINYAYLFTGNEVLKRAVDLAPGTYTYEVDMDEKVSFSVSVVPEEKMIMDAWEEVYNSVGGDGTVEIPEGTGKVRVLISGEENTSIRSLVFSNGEAVKLDYPFLPDNITNRMQDSLFTSSSLLLRLQYVKDALKLWIKAPIFGRGLASVDSLYTSVQPFHYETKFVHNHLLQYMTDLGLIGLLCFLMIVVSLAILLVRKWRKDGDSLAALFLTCLVMMNLHSLMEISFSIRAYMICAYFLLAIMTIAYGEPLFLKGKETVKKASAAAAAGLWIILASAAGVTISYRTVLHLSAKFESANYDEFMQTLETFISFDALENEYYKTLYVANGLASPKYQAQAIAYAHDLRATGTLTYCDAAARYYYLPTGQLEEAFECTLEGIAQKASDDDAWNLELDFYRASVLTAFEADWENAKEPFLRGVGNFVDTLTAFNDGRIQPIELTEANQAFLEAVAAVQADPEMSLEESYALLAEHSYADSEAAFHE